MHARRQRSKIWPVGETMKKRLLPIWVILFSAGAVALMSANVRSQDAGLTTGTTNQTTTDTAQSAGKAATDMKSYAHFIFVKFAA